METVVMNVGGTTFETTQTTLQRFPNTLLGRLDCSASSYNVKKEYYFFDRNPLYFHSVLDFYRTGSLHLPSDVCGATLRDELAFWEISEKHISDCCLHAYFKYDQDMVIINHIKEKFETPGIEYKEAECEVTLWWKIKRAIWLFMDQPNSSTAAKIYHMLFLCIVLISAIGFCIQTLPELREKLISDDVLEWLLNNNHTILPLVWTTVDLNNPKQRMFATTELIPALHYLDRACGGIFSLEFLIHFASCPIKSRFLCNLLNVLDLVLLADIWITFGLEQNLELIFSAESTINLFIFFKCIAILRLFRFFRLVKMYSELRIMFMALCASLKELMLLIIVFLIASLFFASFIYYAEFLEYTTFPNMLIGVWWAIVTMTTLGYGDHFPKSNLGYAVGTVCSVCGLLILAMPIAIVANNFNCYYLRNKEREKLNEMRQKCRSKHATIPFFTKKKIADGIIMNEIIGISHISKSH